MSPPGSGTTPTPSTGGGVATPTTTSAQGDQTPGNAKSTAYFSARPARPPQLRFRIRRGVCPALRDELGRKMSRLPSYYEREVRCAAAEALRDGIGRLPQFDVAVVSESQLVEWFLDGAETPWCYEARPVQAPDGTVTGRVFLVRLRYVEGRLP